MIQKSAERQAIELMLNSLTLFITFIPPCLGFYTNYFVSKTFRTNAKKVIQLNLTRCFVNHVNKLKFID